MMIKAKVNQKNKESNKEAHTSKRAKEKAIRIEAQDESDEFIEITFPEEQEQESLVKDTLNLKQVVSDPDSIHHTIIHNKRTLLDFLFMQSKKSGRIPNIALFFGLDCKIKKKDIKAVLDAFNISFYDENINENFKRSFAFITQAKADYGLIVLEKESGELIDVILANETINDIYDLSLEIWNLFENANPYPQAKSLSGKSCMLLYDNFITRYSGNIYFHMGSISSLDIRERLKDKREQNIFGYIERGVSSGIDSSEYEYNKEQAQKALRALSEYFDDDMLAFVNTTSFNAPFSALVKDNGKKLQVLFFSDEYDSNGVDVDNNFFTDPYLALLDTLGEEEEIYAESLYGVNLLEPKEQAESMQGNEKDDNKEQNWDFKADSFHTKSFDMTKAIIQSVRDASNAMEQDIEEYDEVSSEYKEMYLQKEKQNAFIAVFELSNEEYAKLTPKDFQNYQKELNALLKNFVIAIEHFEEELEVEYTQNLRNMLEDKESVIFVESFFPLSLPKSLEFLSGESKRLLKGANRALFLNLIRAGAEVENELVEQAQNAAQWYFSSQLQRYNLYQALRKNKDSKLYDEKYSISDEQKEAFVLSLPTTKILQELCAILRSAYYTDGTVQIRALQNLVRESELDEWILPQYEELFIGGEATNYNWQLLSYERVQNQQNYDEAYNAIIEKLKKSLQSGEQILFYEDILKYEDSLKNRVDSQILHKRGKAKSKWVIIEVDSTDREGAYDMLFKAIMLSDFDLFQEAIANGADANGVVSAKQAESELAREQYLCEEGASHYAMAVGKILDCIALDDEDLSEESLKEECTDAFKILFAMRDLKPCQEVLEDAKSLLEDTFADWWYEAYKEADELGFKGDLDDEEALHTWLRNHKPLTYFEILAKELGLELELSWE